jgi:hypothetical protein
MVDVSFHQNPRSSWQNSNYTIVLWFLVILKLAPWARSSWWCNYSISWTRNSIHFMEPGASLPCSQKIASGPYPEPVEFSTYPHIPFFKIPLNIILTSVIRSFMRDISIGFSDQHFVSISYHIDVTTWNRTLLKKCNSFSSSQENTDLLWNPTTDYTIHKGPAPHKFIPHPLSFLDTSVYFSCFINIFQLRCNYFNPSETLIILSLILEHLDCLLTYTSTSQPF